MGIYKKCLEFKNRTGRWPRTKILINGREYGKKELLKDKENNAEYLEEFDLSSEWQRSAEYKLLVSNAGKEIEDFPKKYQDMVRNLRAMGIGLRSDMDIVTRCEMFYKKYGRVPAKVTKEQAINDEKRTEKRLYDYMSQNGVRKILEEYVSMEIEDIPEKHQDFVRRFRAMGMGIVSQKSTNVKDYIDFVTENRREPMFYNNPKNDMQVIESGVRHKWRMSKVHEMYLKYGGYYIDEVPEEYRDIIGQIRELWLEIDGNHVADEIIEYIKENKREPREISIHFRQFENGLTQEDEMERALKDKWDRCFEKHVIDRFVGYPIREIPKQYKAIVSKMRAVGLGYPESLNTRLYIEYTLKNKKRPRQIIIRGGNRIDINMCSEAEKEELAIRRRWDMSEDKKVYDMYLKGTLDEEAINFYSSMITGLDKAYKLEAEEKKEKSIVNKRKATNKKYKKTEEQERLAKGREKELEETERNYKQQQEELARETEKEPEDAEKNYKQKEETRSDSTGKENNSQYKTLTKKQQEIISAVDNFVTFVETNKRFPRKIVISKGKAVPVDTLPDEVREEMKIRRKFEESKFEDILDTYLGIPIERVPEVYRESIRRCRKLGYGLTFDEYIKFREQVQSSEDLSKILMAVKRTKDKTIQRRKTALELERKIDEELKKKGKEQGDE